MHSVPEAPATRSGIRRSPVARDESGSEWSCDRGFRKEGTGCGVLRVPDHGYINHSGDQWSCEDGFLKKDGACLQTTT